MVRSVRPITSARLLPAAILLLATACSQGQVRSDSRLEPKREPAPPTAAPLPRRPAYLGVVYTASPYGMRIVRVLPRSPAERSGIRPGDYITAANGWSLRRRPSREFHGFVRERQPGSAVVLDLMRRGETRRVEVELAERPPGFVPRYRPFDPPARRR